MTIDHLSIPPRDQALTPHARSGHFAKSYLPKSRLPKSYLATWGILAAVSASYLMLTAINGIELPGSASQQTAALATQTELELSKRAEEAQSLRRSLTDLQTEVSHLKSDLNGRGIAPDVVGALSAIEERASMETGVPVEKIVTAAIEAPTPAPPAAGSAVTTTITAAQSSPPSTASLETGSIAPLNPRKANAKTIAVSAAVVAPSQAALPTTVAAAPPVNFGPAVVKTAPKPFAVHLASAASLDSLRSSWSQISAQNNDALGSLQPHYTSTVIDGAGQTFDLIVGPVKSAVDARKICKTLATRGLDCKVSPFAGDAL